VRWLSPSLSEERNETIKKRITLQILFGEKTMGIKLYGLSTCSRCKIAKMMLEKGNIQFEYVEIFVEGELPQLFIDDKIYYGKDALLKIRELKENTFTHPTDNHIKE
jgi:hypothetical protein